MDRVIVRVRIQNKKRLGVWVDWNWERFPRHRESIVWTGRSMGVQN